MRRHGARRWLFFVPDASQALVTLVSIPVLLAHAGAELWAALAVGQAIGAAAMTVIGYGWGVSGPAELAKTPPAHRPQLFTLAMASRGVVAVFALTAAVLAAVALPTASTSLAAAGAISMAVMGFSATWYFVGEGDPVPLIIWETAPRVAGLGVGLVCVAVGGAIVWFPVLHAAGVLVSIVLCWVRICGRQLFATAASLDLTTVRRVLGGQFPTAVLSGLEAVAKSLPLPLMTFAAPALAPAFAVLDKVQRQSITGMGPITHIIVSRMAARLSTTQDAAEVARASLREVAVVAACLLPVLTFATIPLLWVISAGEMSFSLTETMALAAWACGAFALRTVHAAVLAPTNRTGLGVRNLLAGSFLGMALFAVLAARTSNLALAMTGLVVGQAISVVADIRAVSGRSTR